MRCIRVTGPLVTAEMLARACAEVAARGAATRRSEPIFLVVNDVDLGVVSGAVWEVVGERLGSILGEHVAFAESEPRPDARAPTPTPEAPALRSGRRRRTPRVLIAEHDASYRAQLLASFADAGFDVLGVADGPQALRQLAARPPHVLVADFELPKLAGDDLLTRARGEPGSPVRLGVLIGVALPQVLVPDCHAADLVIGQPLTPDGIVDRVRAALEAKARDETG